MKAIDLYKELQKHNEFVPFEQEYQEHQENLVIQEAEKILEDRSVRELDILKKLGMDSNLREYHQIVERKEKENKFEEVYDILAIKKLAFKFHLRFLKSDIYIGSIDPQLPAKILNFCKKNGLDYHDEETQHRFYILAPKSSFKLQERPKDPIMMYKINEQKYSFVHKWGKRSKF
jgi:hypothetical protein